MRLTLQRFLVFGWDHLVVNLGLEDEHHHGGKDNKTHIEVYREHFQKPFLTATENYYKAESEGFLAENNISDYLRLAEKRLEEEENRVNLYMHSQTKQPVSWALSFWGLVVVGSPAENIG
jgi:hypothetical protein